MNLLKLKEVSKTYITKTGVTYRALKNINLTFEDKGLVFIVGKSGSGKSTMLNILGALDTADTGSVIAGGNDLAHATKSELDNYRNTMVGFVFQEHNLIDSLSVYDNVKLALDMQRIKDGDAEITETLEKLKLTEKSKTPAMNLSGGQRQRVAIARAIVKQPSIVLADEPTGALDSVTGEEVFGIFKEISDSRLVIVVSHDMDKALEYGDRIIELKDGMVFRDIVRKPEGYIPPADSEITFIADSLVKIGKNGRFDEDSVRKVNDILRRNSRKTFINAETDKKKMKALFPNLREAIDDKYVPDVDNERENAENKDFIPYREKKDSTDKKTEFKKGSLPLSKAISFGFNNLKHKIFRLAVTVLMTISAFTMFGFAQTLSAHDAKEAYAGSLTESGLNSISVKQAGNSRINKNVFDNLMNGYDNSYAYQYDYSQTVNVPEIKNFQTVTGFTEIDDISDPGLTLLYGAGTFEETDAYTDIVISERFASELCAAGIAPSLSHLVGKNVKINGITHTVKGIFASEFAFPKDENPVLVKMIQSAEYSIRDAMIFVKKGYRDFIADNTEQYPDYPFVSLQSGYFSAPIETFGGVSVYFYSGNVKSFFANNTDLLSFDYIADGSTDIGTNGVYISEDLLENLCLAQTDTDFEDNVLGVNALNGDPKRAFSFTVSSGYVTKPILMLGDFVVKGIIKRVDVPSGFGYSADDFTNCIVLSEDARAEMISNAIVVRNVRMQITDNPSDTLSLVRKLYDEGYSLNAYLVSEYDNLLMALSFLSGTLRTLSVILFCLVIVLIFTYLNTSIRLTVKQIGILRALGAKMKDCFMIFVIEGLLITLFSSLVSIILLGAISPAINSAISASLGFSCRLINPKVSLYALMVGMSLIVTAVSVIFPLKKLMKLTPVEAFFGKQF